MTEGRLKVDPPLYLASAQDACWRCGAAMPLVCFVAPKVEGTEGAVCTLSDVQSLPASVLGFVRQRFPTYKLKFSKTAQSEYYGNTCPKCGVLSGDFYLHSEPGAPFFPTSEREARRLVLEEVPIEGQVEIEASPGMGVGELILENAGRSGGTA